MEVSALSVEQKFRAIAIKKRLFVNSSMAMADFILSIQQKTYNLKQQFET